MIIPLIISLLYWPIFIAGLLTGYIGESIILGVIVVISGGFIAFKLAFGTFKIW